MLKGIPTPKAAPFMYPDNMRRDSMYTLTVFGLIGLIMEHPILTILIIVALACLMNLGTILDELNR